MDFEKLVQERFSVRKYKSTPVETAKLEKILEAARIAPTACNNQPQRIKVITDAAELAKIDKCTPFRFAAPLVLLVCYDRSEVWANKWESSRTSGETDAAIVVTHMMLQAWDLGIGSCWVQYFDPAEISKQFNLPENLAPISLLPLGYSDCETSSGHGKRKAMKNLLI